MCQLYCINGYVCLWEYSLQENERIKGNFYCHTNKKMFPCSTTGSAPFRLRETFYCLFLGLWSIFTSWNREDNQAWLLPHQCPSSKNSRSSYGLLFPSQHFAVFLILDAIGRLHSSHLCWPTRYPIESE